MNKIKAVLLVANEADTEFEAKLQTLGYEVFSVISDTEALKTITDNSSINMILLDIKLLKIWEANKDVQSSLKKKKPSRFMCC